MAKLYHMTQMRRQIQKTQGEPYDIDYQKLFGFKKENIRWLSTMFVGYGPSKDYLSHTEKMKLCLQFLTDTGWGDKNSRIINTTVSHVISSTITNIASKADMWIKFPHTAQGLIESKNLWQLEHKIQNAVGVVGSTPMRVQKCQIYGDEYINQDGVHALKILATVNGRGMFTSLDTRWPGSATENLIWSKSRPRNIMSTSVNSVMLADEKYDKEPWLLTPIPNPQNPTQLAFNELLRQERAVMEKSFEQVRRRFPILDGIFCLKPKAVRQIITTCFVLHNIAIQLGEEEIPDDEILETRSKSCEDDSQKVGECTGQSPETSSANANQNNSSESNLFEKVKVLQCQIIKPPRQMMSNSGATFGNGLQQHNLTSAIDYLNQNGPTTLATYPSVTTTEPGLMLDKQSSTAYFASQPSPQTFYSTQLVTQAPGTILITNNFGPDESSTISGVNNSFNNSSIRIVTHNNNNSNHTNNNNNNNSKVGLLEEANCKMIADKQQQQPQHPQQQPPQQQFHQLHHLHHQPSSVALPIPTHPSSTSPPNPVKIPNSLVSTTAPVPTTTSTVVLDRINICINNHYGDAATMTTTPTMVPPQSGSLPSPIIPPVIMSQHTTIVETLAPLCTSSLKQREPCEAEMHVDEPDSTTPTNCHSDMVIPMDQDPDPENAQEQDNSSSFDEFPSQKFEIGDDALVKRRDGRYYLGTVVDVHRQQYLVQFDDKTDYWSNVDELMKLSTDVASKDKPTCLACKRESDDDVVEICERCGRGYHRRCTDEVASKAGEWMCKRCVKPMKVSLEEDAEEEKPKLPKIAKVEVKKVNTQFPYALDSLTWDEKHRVNDEHIYCYCGKSGQFDNNMIQCCKCKQWFHVHCVGCVETLFRGDVFFIFGCSVCNDGKEFLRRIEMEWVDLAHLILYNMAIMKNFQKYHHLHKDIYPFALEKRPAFQLPTSMLSLSDNDFKANLLKTLQAHPKLFQCGKEIKKDHAFWGLRSNKPPQGPTYEVDRNEVLCNQLIREKLKINILPHAEAEEHNDTDEGHKKEAETYNPQIKTEEVKKQDLEEDDDDKFTSDDEIPIKLIIEKVKALTSPAEQREGKPTLQDDSGISDQSNDNPTEEKEKTEDKDDSTTTQLLQPKSSRKRKAFTLSKGYKESDKSNDLPRNICDSSSDENSSSSRGTLDLIIPPPKNFLGINNPFRMLTPKKSDNNSSAVTKHTGSSYITKKTVSFGSSSIFTNTLDLNSKIAALKSSGLLPNISNSDIAKAAGQPRLVRTIKRRLSAKDIRIGPNQEVRRRRTRPLSSNVEVISTTTINSIPSNFFPIRTTIPESTNSSKSHQTNSQANSSSSSSSSSHISASTSTSLSTSNVDCVPSATATATHGRRLRKRPERTSPQNSRRNSICSSSSSNSSSGATQLAPPQTTTTTASSSSSSQSQNTVPMSDLKQSVNRYFGAANRIENGENFTIRAKRRLTNGQMQYLIEWES